MFGINLSLTPGNTVIKGGGAAALAIRPVANRTKQPWVSAGGSDGVNTYGRYISRHKVNPGGCSGQFSMAYCNRRGESNGFNSITIEGVRVRYPSGSGSWVALTFSGASTKALAASDNDVWTDSISLQMAEGEYFDVESYVSVASAGQKWPTIERVSLLAANGEGSTLSTSPIGSSPSPLNTTEFYGPVAIRGLSSAPRAIAVFSDSIGNGNFDTPTGDRLGFIQRKFGDTVPIVQCGNGGETVAQWVGSPGHSRRLALAIACGATDAFFAMGTNDIAVGSTYTVLRRDASAMIGELALQGFAVTALPILTKTTGDINTVVAEYQVGALADQFNTFLQGLAGGNGLLSGFIDTRPGWQNASNQILSATLTDDFLHPNAVGHPAIAAALTGGLPSSIPTALIAPTFWSTSAVHFSANSLKASLADGASVTSWPSLHGGVTATETTAPPVLDYDAAPNGRASLVFSSAANRRMVVPRGTAVDDIFASDGLLLLAFRSATNGGGGFGRFFDKGGNRTSWGSTTDIATILDLTTTDASSGSIAASLNAWNFLGVRFRSGTFVRQYIFNSGAWTNFGTAGTGTVVSDAGSDMIIGNSAANNRAHDGDIAGIAWIKGAALSDDEIAAAIAYFRADTGLLT